MNLLEQLAGFCEGSVSFNFLDSPSNISTKAPEEKPQPRSVSVFANHKSINTRQSKSIEKIQSWVPVTNKEIRERKLLKISRTISNKVRNIYFHFWVNFEHTSKNRKQTNRSEKIELGCEKLFEFVSLQKSKNNASFRIDEAFSKLKRFSSKSLSLKMFESSLKNSIMKQQGTLFKSISEMDKISVHLSIFCSVCSNLERKIQIDTFCRIKNQRQINNKVVSEMNTMKINENENVLIDEKQKNFHTKLSKFNDTNPIQDVLISKPIKVENKKCKGVRIIKVEQTQILLNEENEMTSMPLSKVSNDSAFENFPEICTWLLKLGDNVLFFEKPYIQETEEKIFESTIKTANKEPIEERETKTRRSFSKPENTYVPYRSPLNQINLLEAQLTMKKQYETPREKTSGSLSNVFNIDETRIEKLEKKIFGQTQKKENKYSMDGEVWRSDRETLAEIMSSLKSPSISRRNSTNELELERIREKIAGYQMKEKANERVKQNDSFMKTNKSFINIKSEKEIIIGSILNDELAETKKLNKITVSLKCKKKRSEDMNNMITPNGKSQEWKRLNKEEEKSNAKRIQN